MKVHDPLAVIQKLDSASYGPEGLLWTLGGNSFPEIDNNLSSRALYC